MCVYALAAADVGRTEGETLGVALYKGISLWMMDRMETNSWAGSNDGLALSSSSSGISAFRAVTPGPRFPTAFSPVFRRFFAGTICRLVTVQSDLVPPGFSTKYKTRGCAVSIIQSFEYDDDGNFDAAERATVDGAAGEPAKS